MRVAFRVDSSKDIGTGHVMRCMAFAERLVANGCEVLFYCRCLPGNIIEWITTQGFTVKLLTEPRLYIEVKDSSDYAGWLQVSEQNDATEFIEKTIHENIFMVIVDHYALSYIWEKEIKANFDKVIAIDDLVRKHCVDLVIDQTYSRNKIEYLNEDLKEALTGSEYALLREEFSVTRENIIRIEPPKHRLLVTMGGVDLYDSTSKILEALTKQELGWIQEVKVILSEKAPNFNSIKVLVDELSSKYKLYSHVDDMALFMRDASISIGAPGSTSWERACLGLPSVLIPLADNQKYISKVFSESVAAEIVNLNEISSKLITRLEKIKDNWVTYSQTNMSMCDGLGIDRVIQYIFAPVARDKEKVHLKKAGLEHIELVYKWQCEPETRRFARSVQIPSCQDHQLWMTDKINSKDSYFYIIYHGADASGVVRLDKMTKESYSYEVSIFVASEKKRLGLATIALKLIAGLHRHVEMYATVLSENNASKTLFLNLGYENVSKNMYKLIR